MAERFQSGRKREMERISSADIVTFEPYHRTHKAPAKPEIEVAELAYDSETQWTRFIDGHPEATIYHGLAWRNVIRNAFGHEMHYLHARANGQIVGILPLVRLRNFLFGDYLVSIPFANYGGVIANSDEAGLALMVRACELAGMIGSRHIEFRDLRRYANWPARTEKVIMELHLPPSEERLWAGFDAKLRAQIRRADKAGISTVFGGEELLSQFYSVFARNMRDLGTPVYARKFFSTVMRAFPGSAMLAISRQGDQPIAAGLLLRHRERMEIPWASSIRGYNHLGANMALYWSVLQMAIKQDCRVFDFGRSSVDSGTYRFKQQWGAKPRQLFWHYWLKDDTPLPQLTPSNPKYRMAIAIWKRLPLLVANGLGPLIVRHLP